MTSLVLGLPLALLVAFQAATAATAAATGDASGPALVWESGGTRGAVDESSAAAAPGGEEPAWSAWRLLAGRSWDGLSVPWGDTRQDRLLRNASGTWRGLAGHSHKGDLQLQLFGGVWAPTWDALELPQNSAARPQLGAYATLAAQATLAQQVAALAARGASNPQRAVLAPRSSEEPPSAVLGLALQGPAAPGLQWRATSLASETGRSAASPSRAWQEETVHSHRTLGLMGQQQAWSWQAEAAYSRAGVGSAQTAYAIQLQGAWQGRQGGVRAQLNDTQDGYATLGQAARAAQRNLSLGADWLPSEMLSLNARWQGSQSAAAGCRTVVISATLAPPPAAVGVASPWAGWSLALNQVDTATHSDAGLGQTSQTRQHTRQWTLQHRKGLSSWRISQDRVQLLWPGPGWPAWRQSGWTAAVQQPLLPGTDAVSQSRMLAGWSGHWTLQVQRQLQDSAWAGVSQDHTVSLQLALNHHHMTLNVNAQQGRSSHPVPDEPPQTWQSLSLQAQWRFSERLQGRLQARQHDPVAPTRRTRTLEAQMAWAL